MRDCGVSERITIINTKLLTFGRFPAACCRELQSSQVETTIRFIEENVQKAVAVGEMGLDFWLKRARKDPKERDLQKEVFRELLELAKRYGKPAIIHARGAWEDCYQLAVEMQVQSAVFHWYSGPVELIDELLGCNYYISATPAAEYSEGHKMSILRTPLNNLLLETDCPVRYQGIESEPAHVRKTLEAVARIKGLEKEKVAEVTTQNALSFFDLESVLSRMNRLLLKAKILKSFLIKCDSDLQVIQIGQKEVHENINAQS